MTTEQKKQMEALLERVAKHNQTLPLDFQGELDFQMHDFRFMTDLHECKDIIDSINEGVS